MRRFHAGTLWDTLGCAGILWEILGQAGIGWGRLGRAGALWVILGILGAGWGLVLPRRASHNEGSPFGRRMVELGGGIWQSRQTLTACLGF
jgi:hypothetical protein